MQSLGQLFLAHSKANPSLALCLDLGPLHVSRSTLNKLPESSRGHSKNQLWPALVAWEHQKGHLLKLVIYIFY